MRLRRVVITYLRACAVPLPITHAITLAVFVEEGSDRKRGPRDVDNVLKGVMGALDDTGNCLWCGP